MPSIFEIAAILLTLSAVFGWINHKYSPLPHAAGLLLMGMLASLVLVAVDVLVPDKQIYAPITATFDRIDFTDVLMNGMLGFLLFAGALHVDLAGLRDRAFAVAALACLGTALSTAIVGFGFLGLAELFGQPMTLEWALVFGALISPTDPVAVMSVLRTVQVPKAMEAELQGESLFNDGVGVVIFAILVRFAVGDTGHETSPAGIAELLLVEAGGGLLLGVITGTIAYWGMRLIDDYPIEVLISLALVVGTYALAQRLHMSGPLAVVAAGLLIGDRGARFAMSDQTQKYVFALWTLIDEVLNSVLFLLIGLEVLVLRFTRAEVGLALAAIPLVLAGRLAAVAGAPLAFPRSLAKRAGNLPFLVWAGVRGGISVALALSVPDSPSKPAILTATYAVVLFSIVIQGSTLGAVIRRTVPQGDTTG